MASLRPVKVVLSEAGHVGQALKAAREALGLAEDDIAQVTRVRSGYIAAIEAFDFKALPSRPFVIGYVRAYARALGLEAEAVVARFRVDAPEVDGKLRAPVEFHHDAFVSIRRLMAMGAMVALAVAGWNIAKRAELHSAAPVDAPPRATVVAHPQAGPAEIGAPIPTPPEATTPPAYQTPGLAPPPPAKSEAAAPAPAEAQPAATGAPFVPAGAIYGAPEPGSGLILQARKATTLIVRGGGGVVYFARVLSPGEAWRAPAIAGLTAEVGLPSEMEVFVGGTSHGRLGEKFTPLAKAGA